MMSNAELPGNGTLGDMMGDPGRKNKPFNFPGLGTIHCTVDTQHQHQEGLARSRDIPEKDRLAQGPASAELSAADISRRTSPLHGMTLIFPRWETHH